MRQLVRLRQRPGVIELSRDRLVVLLQHDDRLLVAYDLPDRRGQLLAAYRICRSSWLKTMT